MGVMLVFLAIIVILAVVIVILIKFCKPGSKLHNLFLKIKGKIFWNSLLRYILQSNLKIAIGTLFALYLIKVSSDAEAVNAGLSICIVAALLFMPIFFYILLNRNRDSL